MASDGFTPSSSVGLKRYEINAPVLPVPEESLAVYTTGLLFSDLILSCLQSQEDHSVITKGLRQSVVRFFGFFHLKVNILIF